MEVFVLKK